jgi:hypothetical protein
MYIACRIEAVKSEKWLDRGKATNVIIVSTFGNAGKLLETDTNARSTFVIGNQHNSTELGQSESERVSLQVLGVGIGT